MAITKQEAETTVYEAAHHAAVLVDRSELGMLKVTGETRLDLIHRMSTQAVADLASGQGAATILTTDIGRIIDRLILYVAEKAVYVVTGENNADAIARYLMRFVFFQDDFHMQDISAETAVLAVYGPQAEARLTAAGLPAGELPLHHWRQAEVAGVTAYVHRTDPIAGDGYFVTCEAADREVVWQQLLGAGLVPADEAMFELLRIEAGLPRFGRELTGDYIPLEANLWDDVSFTKGCYIGQEIIARMESRGRLAKKLVRLRLDAPVDAGVEITAGGRRVGVITSAAVGPNGPVALGYVKTAVLHGRAALTAGEIRLRPEVD
ncbi:MAG: YgfZ/GcvT domain-containing protein [Anaerolineae bacterium]